MATIKARRQANGAIRYTAILRKRLDKVIVHREAKTFIHRSAALSCGAAGSLRDQRVELFAVRQKKARHALIAFIRGATPTICIARFRL